MKNSTFQRFVLLCAVSLGIAACTNKPTFTATDVTGAAIGQNDWNLQDASGRTFTKASLKGKVTAVFFGFTRCPDVCPTTLVDYATALKSLGADAEKVNVLFITVDPERDTFPALNDYVKAFNPSFIALRGDAASTKAAGDSFKVFYAKSMAKDGKPLNYTVDHTAASYIFDAQGNIRLYVKHGQAPDLIAKDLKQLLN